nr:hypothetical protein BACY1_03000 [Tenacibaculum mesophilum]
MKKLLILAVTSFFLSCSNSEQSKEITQLQNQLKQYEMTTDKATKNKETVRRFFNALTAENAETVANLFAEDAKHINPYNSGIFPTGANGKEGIKNYWEPVFPNFDGMTFDIEEIHAMEDPNMVFVKYKGDIKLKNNAGVYSNDYYSTFKFDDNGKITEYVEIFNPIVAARGFGLLDKIK